jgi:hypothetical protein
MSSATSAPKRKKARKRKSVNGRPKGSKNGRATPKSIKKAEDMATALEMRKQGYSYDQIAGAMECSKKHAWALVQDALKEYRIQELAEDVVAMEVARLDKAIVGLSSGVDRGDTFSINAMISVSERRLKLLGQEPAKNDKIEHEGTVKHDHGGAIQVNITPDDAKL